MSRRVCSGAPACTTSRRQRAARRDGTVASPTCVHSVAGYRYRPSPLARCVCSPIRTVLGGETSGARRCARVDEATCRPAGSVRVGLRPLRAHLALPFRSLTLPHVTGAAPAVPGCGPEVPPRPRGSAGRAAPAPRGVARSGLPHRFPCRTFIVLPPRFGGRDDDSAGEGEVSSDPVAGDREPSRATGPCAARWLVCRFGPPCPRSYFRGGSSSA